MMGSFYRRVRVQPGLSPIVLAVAILIAPADILHRLPGGVSALSVHGEGRKHSVDTDEARKQIRETIADAIEQGLAASLHPLGMKHLRQPSVAR